MAQSEEDIQQQVAEAKRALMADINQLALQQAKKILEPHHTHLNDAFIQTLEEDNA